MKKIEKLLNELYKVDQHYRDCVNDKSYDIIENNNFEYIYSDEDNFYVMDKNNNKVYWISSDFSWYEEVTKEGLLKLRQLAQYEHFDSVAEKVNILLEKKVKVAR